MRHDHPHAGHARTGRTLGRTLAGGALALALLAGCGGSGSGGGKASGSTTTAGVTTTTASGATTTAGPSTTVTGRSTTTPPATTAPPTTTAGARPGDILPPGDTVALLKRIGTTTSVSGVDTTPLTFDEVQFLTGQAAIDAAVAHHDNDTDANGKPFVDNDYYVVNDNPKLRTMLVAGTAQITIDGCNGGCPAQQSASLAQAASNHIGYFKLHVVGHGSAARITKISQIFVP